MIYFFFVAVFLVATAFLEAVFLVVDFLVADFLVAFFLVFLSKAVGSMAIIIFFTSSKDKVAKSFASYFSPSLFLPNLSICFPKRIKGPQRPFSKAIFSSGHC